jgi:hypothetical protein
MSNHREFNFGEICNESTFIVEVTNTEGLTKTFKLKFTLLPVVKVTHRYVKIPDEPKIISTFCLVSPRERQSVYRYAEIEVRGGSTRDHPKKSYGFKLVDDENLKKEVPLSLLGMPAASDWILNSGYIDKSNVRNKISFDIWGKIQEASGKAGNAVMPSSVQGQYVELFINETYQGLYCLSETIDEKKLGLTGNGTSGQAFLYKSEYWSDATTFDGVPDTARCEGRWAEWEQKYPDPEIYSCWKPLYDFVDFVVSSGDEVFSNSITSQFEIDQAVDFYILINLIKGDDNAGKNLFLAKKHENAPFVIVPWDLDVSWGRNWQGHEKQPYGVVCYSLFERLIETNAGNFNGRMKTQWKNLRVEVLTPETIQEMFSNQIALLIESGAAKREKETWLGSLPDIEAERLYIENFITKRIEFLDNYFNNL